MVAPAIGGGEPPERPALRRVKNGRGPTEAQRSALLAERLRSRRAEIEHAVHSRVRAISDPAEVADPIYAEGLRAAVSASLDYALEVIGRGEGSAPQIPAVLFAQARLAVRHEVGLDTVLRRYSAGYVVLSDYQLAEAEAIGIRGAALRRLLGRTQAVLDRLFAAVSDEYGRELAERPGTSEQRRAERIERLLAGEPLDTSELAYDFDGHHLGILAKGPCAADALRSIAASLDRRLLAVRREEDTLWAWLGGRRAFEMDDLIRRLKTAWPPGCALALGEPGEGLAGWRLTHHQARAGLAVALRDPDPLVRYADVALLSAVMADELASATLRNLYLGPLEAERDGGELAKETLRAYFAAGRNVSSAAAALGVLRHTVTNRLRVVEKRIGRSLGSCATEIEILLRLEELGDAARSSTLVD